MDPEAQDQALCDEDTVLFDADGEEDEIETQRILDEIDEIGAFDGDIVARVAELSLGDSSFSFEAYEGLTGDTDDSGDFGYGDGDEGGADISEASAERFLALRRGAWKRQRASQMLFKMLSLQKPVITDQMVATLQQRVWACELAAFVTLVPSSAVCPPADTLEGAMPHRMDAFAARPAKGDEVTGEVQRAYRATLLFTSCDESGAMREVLSRRAYDVSRQLFKGFWPESKSVMQHVCRALDAVARNFQEPFYAALVQARRRSPPSAAASADTSSAPSPDSNEDEDGACGETAAGAGADADAGADAGADAAAPAPAPGDVLGTSEASILGDGPCLSEADVHAHEDFCDDEDDEDYDESSEDDSDDSAFESGDAAGGSDAAVGGDSVDADTAAVASCLGPMLQCLRLAPVPETLLGIVCPEEPPVGVEDAFSPLKEPEPRPVRDARLEKVKWRFYGALANWRLVEKLVNGVTADLSPLPAGSAPLRRAIEHGVACQELLCMLLERLAQSPSGEILLTPLGYCPELADALVDTMLGAAAAEQRSAAAEVLLQVMRVGREPTRQVQWRSPQCIQPETISVRNALFESAAKFRARVADHAARIAEVLSSSTDGSDVTVPKSAMAGGGKGKENAGAPRDADGGAGARPACRLPVEGAFRHPGRDGSDAEPPPPAFSHLRLLVVGVLAEVLLRGGPKVLRSVGERAWMQLGMWLFRYPDSNMYHALFYDLFFVALRSNEEPVLRALLHGSKLVNNIVDSFASEAAAEKRRRRKGNRGYLLRIANALRLQSSALGPAAFLRHYLDSHSGWKAFLPQLLGETQSQQRSGLGKPVPEAFPMSAMGMGIYPSPMRPPPGHEPPPPADDGDVDLDLGSDFAAGLGFAGVEPFEADSPAAGKKKRRKKRKKKGSDVSL